MYKRKKLGAKKLEQPVYKFMTDEQLQEAITDAKSKSEEMLQMPPVVAVRQPIDKTLAHDPALLGLDTSKHVFTDVTFGVKNSERLVVVRELDGKLRTANWDEKDRMNQIYSPTPGRLYRTPQMFTDDRLESLLKQREFEFVLDRACIQFEPDSSEYQRVTSVTYQWIDQNNEHDSLRSTRHFGPLAFFLVWFKSIDNLLLDLIETRHAGEAVALIRFYAQVHKIDVKGDSDVDLIADYVGRHSSKKAQLELMLQAYREAEEERKALSRGVRKAHGLV